MSNTDPKLFEMEQLYIAVDFDGTIVKHAYPDIGAPVPGAILTIAELIDLGHKVFLWTNRTDTEEDNTLQPALDYIKSKGIELWAVNKNPDQPDWSRSPKAFAHAYIDDLTLGCPLIRPEEGMPYVDWHEVRKLLKGMGVKLA